MNKGFNRDSLKAGLETVKVKLDPESKEKEIENLNKSEKFETIKVQLNPTKMATAADLLFRESNKYFLNQGQTEEKYQLTNTLKLLMRDRSTDEEKINQNYRNSLVGFSSGN